MKQRIIRMILVLVILVEVISVQNTIDVQAASKVSSFITNKRFKGKFNYKGEKTNWRKGWYSVMIHGITKSGKVRLSLDKGGRNASPLYGTSVLVAKIKGNKANFTYHEDGWGNKGKGAIIFNKNGTIYLRVKQTYTAEGNRSTLAISKTIFKRVKK